MRRLRFQHKVALALIGLLVATQLVTLLVVGLVSERSVRAQIDDRLQVGARVIDQALLDRSRLLLDTVSVLADDFGFREAVATGDRETMQSVLANHGARAGAQSAVLLDLDGRPLGASPRAARDDAAEALAPLIEDASRDGFAVELATLAGRPQQVALVPVRAPVQIGWVAVGFALDDAVAESLAGVTGLEIALFTPSGRLFASSLAGPARAALQASVAGRDGEFDLAGAAYVGNRHALPSRHAEPPSALLLAALDPALAPLRSLIGQVLAFSALALLAALLAAAWLARGVTRPVTQLAEAANRFAEGEIVSLPGSAGRDEIGELRRAFESMREGIAEREQRIVHQSRHDPLTDLPNRALALAWLQQRLDSNQRHEVAVLMLDLDRFREINDTLGHAFGDRVLVEVAGRLVGEARERDLVARLGGDEFIVVLSDADLVEATARAAALIERVAATLDIDDSQIRIEASLGIAVYPQHAGDATSLLRRADIAMYDAKSRGERIAVYQSGRDERHLRQLRLLGDLRDAIADGAIELEFQPKVALAGGEVGHVEALARWRHPELGRIGPDEFIPLAEQSGLVRDLSRLVLDRALEQGRRWQDEGLTLSIAVNLSAVDLMDAALPDRVIEMLQRHRVAPGRLVLEITESALMRDTQYAIRVLERLRRAGVRLSIDDFGTGHSSLAQLRRLPVDELKIDKSFILQMHAEGEDALIVRSTIELAHTMGLTVIAEGVENEAGLRMLEQYRCDLVQGFLFSPPLPAAELGEWLRRRQQLAAAATEDSA